MNPHALGMGHFVSHGMNRMEREAAKVRGEYEPEVLRELRRQHRDGESPLGMMVSDPHARLTQRISDEVQFANSAATGVKDLRAKVAKAESTGRGTKKRKLSSADPMSRYRPGNMAESSIEKNRRYADKLEKEVPASKNRIREMQAERKALK